MKEFASAARDFCTLIEAHGRISRKEFLENALLSLSRLYATGVRLPRVNSPGKHKERRLTHKEWQALFEGLGRKLGPRRFYRECFDPWSQKDPVTADLADDLADVYRDLKPGIEAFKQGTRAVRKAVVAHWRLGLAAHWGHHATGALLAFHHLLA